MDDTMHKAFPIRAFLSTMMLVVIMASGASAQGTQPQAQPQAQMEAKTPEQLAGNVASACIGNNWESQNCLRNVSEGVLYMAADYAARLQHAGQPNGIETLKQKCAAATAATQQEVPAYAMESALTTCANSVYTVTQQTGVSPDPDLYQLVIAPILCLKGDERCKGIERQLGQY